MHILITGAGGMIGRKLTDHLVSDKAISGREITALTLADVFEPPRPAEFTGALSTVAADLSSPDVASRLIASRPDVIFHLAAIVSGEAEADFEKGYRVNLDGSRLVFEAIRAEGLKSPYAPRVVFASSIAVFGAPFPEKILDDFALTPLTSYGTQKTIGELLLADYSRRGFFDGVGIRLPTICIRPGKPNLAASGFFSSILREPLAGREAVLPVSEEVRHWFASPRSALGFLLHAATIDTARIEPRRNLNMPGLSATVGEEIEALRRVAGESAVKLIRREPDPAIDRIVAGWARDFDARRALDLGFEAETSFDDIIRAHVEDELGGRIGGRPMLLGCIADDFTGASDLANTLATGGMATVQFVGIPRRPAPEGCEAGVVALKTRSIPPGEAVARSLAALDWLKAQGCRQYVFKYCSTFDSTPEGNIGPVAEALLDALGAPVAVVCPVFPATGRTLFMGHLYVKDRLLNESGMEKHPLTPMTDPDIRRWLRRQTRGEVGFVPYGTVRLGADAITQALDSEAAAGRRLVVIDAITNDDLLAIDTAVANQKLVTGGSGIALGLPENFRKAGLLGARPSAYEPAQGPGIVLSGSCSSASRAQLTHYLKSHPGLRVDPAALMIGKLSVDHAAAFVAAHRNEAPIVYSTMEPAEVEAAQAAHGREAVANTIEHFFGKLATRLVADGFVRIAVGGGETSGAVVTALKADRLVIGPEIDPGVPALAIDGEKPLRLALKSGNFGAIDFYDKALAALGTP